MHLGMNRIQERFKKVAHVLYFAFLFIFMFSFFTNLFIGTRALVVGKSMENSLQDGEVGVVLYHEKINPGDIIVFDAEINGEHSKLVKRVIAKENDTVEIINGIVLVNGFPTEDYAKFGSFTGSYSEQVVPNNCYFVLGDNRDVSLDSRYAEIGFINKKEVIGKFHKIF